MSSHQTHEPKSWLYLTFTPTTTRTSPRFETFEMAQQLAYRTVRSHVAQNMHCACFVRPSLKPANMRAAK